MSKILSALLVALMTLFTSTIGYAEDSTTANSIGWSYAKCLVDIGDERARKVLAEVPETAESDKRLEKLQRPRCLSKTAGNFELRFPHALIRGFLAEHLLRRDFVVYLGKAKHDTFEIFDGAASDLTDEDLSVQHDVALIVASECATLAAKEKVDAFFFTHPGSLQERAAINELVPFLSACLDNDVVIKFSSAMFRSYFAEAAYRNSVKNWQANNIRAAD